MAAKSKTAPARPSGDVFPDSCCSTTGLKMEYRKLEELLRSAGHEEILDFLQDNNLGDKCDNGRSILYNLLHDATNGNKLVEAMLDKCVSTTETDMNHPDCAMVVDVNFCALRNKKKSRLANRRGCTSGIIKDIIHFKSYDANKLLSHPVIETYLDHRWGAYRKLFLFSFLLYCTFLVIYSMYLGNIFYRQDTHKVKLKDFINLQDGRIVFPGRENLRLDVNQQVAMIEERRNKTWALQSAFSSCRNSQKLGTCALETSLAIMVTLLFLLEMVQLIAIGIRHYVREYENFIELTVLSLATSGLFLQDSENAIKWFSAFGIVLSYLELVFLLGRYPPLGGRISIMFYNITRHLLRSVSNLMILVLGFAFGFFIMHNGTSGDSFENPFKAIVKSLMMVLGEYEINSFYDTEFPDAYSRHFTVLLVVLLALVGSLVMVNLFVAIIVSDIAELKRSGHIQELVNKAHHIVYCETILGLLPDCWSTNKSYPEGETDDGARENGKIYVCPHSMCRCTFDRLNPSIVSRLKEVASNAKAS